MGRRGAPCRGRLSRLPAKPASALSAVAVASTAISAAAIYDISGATTIDAIDGSQTIAQTDDAAGCTAESGSGCGGDGTQHRAGTAVIALLDPGRKWRGRGGTKRTSTRFRLALVSAAAGL